MSVPNFLYSRVILKKLWIGFITAFFFLCPSSFSMDIETTDIEVSQDQKPKHKCVFILDLSASHEWKSDVFKEKSVELRLTQAMGELREVLNDFGYIPFGNSWDNSPNKSPLFAGKFSSKKLIDCILLQVCYQERSHFPCLENRYSIFTTENHTYDFELLQEGSWRWVTRALEKIPGSFYTPPSQWITDSDLCERVQKRVKRRGVQNSLSRLSVVVTSDHTYSFYSLFDTEKERKRGEKILSELKEYMLSFAPQKLFF